MKSDKAVMHNAVACRA